MKQRLIAADISFTEVRVDQDKAAYDFLVSEGHRSVPQMYLNGKCVKASDVLN